MDITSVFLATLAPLAAALYVIGIFLKKSERVKDKDIPIILIVVGILGAVGIMPIQDKISFTTAIVQGVLAAGSSVLANQVYIQQKYDK